MRQLKYDEAVQVAATFLPEIPDDNRLPLNGIYHYAKHLIATDGAALIQMPAYYERAKEGKILTPDGKVVETYGARYPETREMVRRAIEHNTTALAPDWEMLAWLCWVHQELKPDEHLFCTVNGRTFVVRNLYRVAMTAIYLRLDTLYVPNRPNTPLPAYATTEGSNVFVLIMNARTNGAMAFDYTAPMAEPNF